MANTFTRGFRRSYPRYNFAAVNLQDFSGGLNLASSVSELADNESPDLLNVTLDDRGGVVKRLGYSRVNGSALVGTPQQLFWWDEQAVMIYQCGATVYSTSNNFTSVTLRKTYTTTERAAFTTFNGKLIAVHPTDRVSTFDGTTWTDVGVGSPKGNTIAVWQNKVWVSGDSANPTRVNFSNAGDATTWGSFVDVREGSDAPVKALGSGQGMDISGRPGLLVFKARSMHRINDSTSGSYTTITTEGGASNHNAVVSALGVTAAISERGVIILDGNDTPTVASTKIEPLFRATQINISKADLFAAGVYRDRIYFSFPYGSGQTTNNRTLEFIPSTGAFVIHDFAASAYATYHTAGNERLYGASTSTAYIHWLLNTGADNGAAIDSHYQTKWIEPMVRGKVRFRQATVDGRGTFTLYVKSDYSLGTGDAFSIAPEGTAGIWGIFVWGTGTWGPDSYEQTTRLYSLGVGRAIAFRVQESSSTSALSPALLGDGNADEVGAWSFYGLRLDFVPLGLS